MFDSVGEAAAQDPVARLSAGLRALRPAGDDEARLARLRALEELKATAAALQAMEMTAFAASQRAAQAAVGVKRSQAGRGIAHQVALALRLSPHRAQHLVSRSVILTSELPNTLAELLAGRTNEWRAEIMARETIFLSRADRATVDAALGPKLVGMGDLRIRREARALAYRLDPAGFVERSRAAANDRRVSIRPAPDAMAWLSVLLPVAQAVACYAALARTADSTTAAGDERGRGQIMADTLVERVTGQAAASEVPIEINLIMTDQTLLAGDSEPAVIDGAGPIPAPIARELITEPPDETPMWIRQLYRSPRSGELVAMQSRRRFFPAGQRHFIKILDQECTTPWCGAPIRHIDHDDPVAAGGRTEIENARGTCASCNYAKQMPGWRTQIIRRGHGREVITITPTGHFYRHRSLDPPGARPRADVQVVAARLIYEHAA